MTNETKYTKSIDNVNISRLENGFVVSLKYDIKFGDIPDAAIESEEMKRWEMEQEHAQYKNPPKAYVFSTYEDMMKFIQIQTEWV